MNRWLLVVVGLVCFSLGIGGLAASPQSEPARAAPAPPQARKHSTLRALPARHSVTTPQQVDPLIFTESFDSFPNANWILSSQGTSVLSTTWGATTFTFDDFSDTSTQSAWPAAGGPDAVDPAAGDYPPDLDNWMVAGPLDLSTAVEAEVEFSLDYNLEPDFDWLGLCVTDGSTGDPLNELYDYDNSLITECYWWSGDSGGWDFEIIDLSFFAGSPDVYIGWVFESDGTNDVPYAGAFVDEIQVYAYSELPEDDFADWDLLYEQPFDGLDLASDAAWTLSSNQAGLEWGVTSNRSDDINPDSTSAASALPSSGYPAGLESWMFYGPLDLSNREYADVNFSVLHDLTEGEDWLGFCIATSASTPTPNSFDFDNCAWWTGSSQEEIDGTVYFYWDDWYEDLTSFAGQNNVYLGWVLLSNAGSASQEGAFIDELQIWAQAEGQEDSEIDFDAEGIAISNGDFANGLADWQTADLSATETGSVEVLNGAAVISGSQYLYHTFTVPTDTVDLYIEFDKAVSTTETMVNEDFICVGFTSVADPGDVLVDGGCWDVFDVPDYARGGGLFEFMSFALSDAELALIKGKEVALTFETVQDQGGSGTGTTITYLDNVVAYATAISRVSDRDNDNLAPPRDNNEPNDEFADATTLSCGETRRGVFGDVGTSWGDTDYFELKRLPAGEFVVDINAQSLRPPSSADSFLTLYNPDGTPVVPPGNPPIENDDDGPSLDSRLIFGNPMTDTTYYVEAFSFIEGPDAFYDITLTCRDDDAPPPPPQQDNPEERRPGQDAPPPNKKAWTVMIYFSAEDQEEDWLGVANTARQGIEAFIADKQEYLNVIMLVDGPNKNGVPNDTVRYVVQPDGNYTDGVNRWPLADVNMGNQQTLAEFVKWSMRQYPADQFLLSIDDHGHGVIGVNLDYHGKDGQPIYDFLSPTEVRVALKDATENGQRKIDILNYEACWMGMVENAYDLRDFVRYITFYQPANWTSDVYPVFFGALQRSDDALTLGRSMVQNHPEAELPYSYALVDAGKMNDLRAAIDDFATALISADLAQILAARSETQAFAGSPTPGDASQDRIGYLDLWHLADRIAARGIATTQAAAVKAAVEAAVLEIKTVSGTVNGVVEDYSNAHGLSILFPDDEYSFLEDYKRNYEMSRDGTWDDFLATNPFAEETALSRRFRRSANFPNIPEPRRTVSQLAVENFVYLPLVTR